MKKVFIPLVFMAVSGSMCFSQVSKRVGINTNDPKQTLDVEGTMRVTTLGESDENSHLVGWDKTNQQIIDMGKFSKLNFFKKKHFEIPVTQGSSKASDGRQVFHNYIKTEGYNLGFDANNYSLFMSEPRLVYENDENKVVYLKVISVADKETRQPSGALSYGGTSDNEWVNRLVNVVSGINTGYLTAPDRWHVLQGTLIHTSGLSNDPKQKSPFLYEAPKILVYKSGGTWKFTGMYYYTGAANANMSKFKWVFDVFAVDNTWIQYIDNVSMTIKNDNKGLPHVVEPDQGVKYPIVK